MKDFFSRANFSLGATELSNHVQTWDGQVTARVYERFKNNFIFKKKLWGFINTESAAQKKHNSP